MILKITQKIFCNLFCEIKYSLHLCDVGSDQRHKIIGSQVDSFLYVFITLSKSTTI